MIGVNYKSKKELKEKTGQALQYIETSMFGREFKSDGVFCVVGPCPYSNRKYFASVTMEKGLIKKVS